MVLDEAAGKERDVDVTVTVTDSNGEVSAFKASEVKHEGKPLDVVAVEQLILKLADMPRVTHKAIFSTSGYTDGAQAKAKRHEVDLYSMLPWDRPIAENFPDFPGVGTPGEFLAQFQSSLLYWAEWQSYFISTTGPESFSFGDETPLFSPEGKKHQQYSTMLDYLNEVLMRSTGLLCTQSPASNVLKTFPYNMYNEAEGYMTGPAWPHTHTLDLSNDEVYLRLEGHAPFRLDSVTISGHLQWRKRVIEPQFHIFERVSDQAIFAGAAVADYGVDDGRMFAMIFPAKGREVGIHRFQIPEKQKNLIRGLKIHTPP
ncbi:restriction endonuclease [Halomonas sp. PAMB 3264]|uniref:restriction endonuclease n=1 Tax=Halomonas sp. PAMB 3264 TaxID=3075222 RepID=UPI00289AEBC3|nr:restriction endonuclease [Halomonas sp. PAMB 3264]WNL41420.1 restriction endonuclease [Halomonas sp. PAMB 3264]